MDTIVTFEGRKQIANADLRIQYVSFSDASTYYAPDIVSGSADATKRIYFEACNLPQDQITFEADDSGLVYPYATSINFSIKNGKLLQNITNNDVLLTGSIQETAVLSGTIFVSTTDELLASSIDNFSRLQLIGTKDIFFDDNDFAIGNSKLEFMINDSKPLSDQKMFVVNKRTLDSLYQDIRLSNTKNFKFLPPINKIIDESVDKTDSKNTKQFRLGNYVPWSNVKNLTPADIEYELGYYEKLGYAKTVTFDPTSNNNNLVGQFFEIGYDTIKKLDVIDYGKIVLKNSVKHIFFVGKVYTDDNNTHTFVHLFTLVFG